MKNKFELAVVAALFVGLSGASSADTCVTTAAFDKNEIRLFASPLAYEVVRDGKVLVAKTPICVKVDGVCKKDAKPVSTKTAKLSGTVETPVYKKSSISLEGNESFADFGDFGVRLVARPDGVAYRFELKKGGTIDYENASLTIPKADARCWFNRNKKKVVGCEETVPEAAAAGDLKLTDDHIYLPFGYTVEGQTVVVTEANLHNYPILNFGAVEQTEAGVKLSPFFAGYPKKTKRVGGWGEEDVEEGGRWVRIVEHEDYLAKNDGPANLPWRTFLLADRPAQLCEADIVMALSNPTVPGDFSWIKPGKVAWDWWNRFDNAPDKAPNGGCTTKTYERFIDFAAKKGVEYVIFDEGWSEVLNIWKFHPEVDVPHLIKYAEKKGVGIILWMAWAQVYGNEEKVAEHFSKLGAKGFKVDFMDRADAEIAVFLEKFAAACVKHQMLVDYHGVYRPTGLNMTYPNIINYEGIHGLEQLKWFDGREKEMMYNDVAEFYLRLSAGPMDYTPGAMLNHAIGTGYHGSGQFPGSVGTRSRQMAMMALYEAPLQMLCDSPTHYEKNEECFDFMARVPTVWAKTVGLCGCPESIAAAARQAKDGSWYAAGLNTIEPRDYTLCTKFLGEGEWKAEIFRDAPECDKEGAKYLHEKKVVKAGDKLDFHLAPGGGFIVKFTK